MKKHYLLIPVIGILLSCSSEKKQAEKDADPIQEQTVSVEKSIQQLDETLKAADAELEKTQSEIDSLLNDI
ncbi:MAG: hypothetical protein RBT74_05370 [Tenuifilaceae bacterium]|nr:hypothetical protein [Tenuifilaceae bacterium]